MKNVHLLVPDLFLPAEFAADVCAGLQLPALEHLLARAVPTPPPVLNAAAGGADSGHALESALCRLFGVTARDDAPLAAISAAFDGLPDGGDWLRADPVHLRLQREQVVLLPQVTVSADEAELLCVSLNEYFSRQGIEFFAPHPQRWYLRVEKLPDICTVPLSQAAGRNIRAHLPSGVEARRWQQVFNEAQMLLHAHPVNEAREARGEPPVNSVWLWGNGKAQDAQAVHEVVSSDEVLVEMLAAAANIPFSGWSENWQLPEVEGTQLLVWTGLRSALQHGDLSVWRQALQDFETGYAAPLWQAVRAGRIARLELDVLGGAGMRRFVLTRGDAWKIWRRAKRLADYSVESTQQK